MKALSAGVSVVSITPPIGVELSGYGYYLERRCDGVRDEVLCKALVLDDGARKVAVVASDLIGLDRETTTRIRRTVEERTGIPPDHVLLACSHTHSGPATIRLRGCGEVDEAYVRLLARKIAGAVTMAYEDMEPATVRVGHGTCGLGFNRVVPDAPVDREVGVLRFDREDGSVKAFVVNFSAHAVTFGGDNRKVSRDYPGGAADAVEAVFPGSTMLFLQGSCGDVNPLDRYRNRPDTAGRVLAGEVLKVSAGASEVVESLLGAASREIALPLAIPDREAVRRKLEEDRKRWEESGRMDRGLRFSVESGERLLEKLEGDPSDPFLSFGCVLHFAQGQAQDKRLRPSLRSRTSSGQVGCMRRFKRCGSGMWSCSVIRRSCSRSSGLGSRKRLRRSTHSWWGMPTISWGTSRIGGISSAEDMRPPRCPRSVTTFPSLQMWARTSWRPA